MKRICINCGKEIGFIQSILNNKCCSYKCDMEAEELSQVRNRDEWEAFIERQNKIKERERINKRKKYNKDNKEIKENVKEDKKENVKKEEGNTDISENCPF